MNNDYLLHYGVKGMKWGVRHDRIRTGIRNRYKRQKLTPQERKRIKPAAKKAVKSYAVSLGKSAIAMGAVAGVTSVMAMKGADINTPGSPAQQFAAYGETIVAAYGTYSLAKAALQFNQDVYGDKSAKQLEKAKKSYGIK